MKHVLCFLNTNKVWGGGENWHLESALAFADEGYQVVLACQQGCALELAARKKLEQAPALDMFLHILPLKLGSRSFLNPFKKANFRKILQRFGVTHVIAGLPQDLKFSIFALSHTTQTPAGSAPPQSVENNYPQRVKLYYRRGSAIAVKPSRLNCYLYKRLDALIVNSHETGRGVLKSAQLIAADKVHVIYNGLNIQEFDNALKNYRAVPAEAKTTTPLKTPANTVVNPQVNTMQQSSAAGLQNVVEISAPRNTARLFTIGNAGRLSKQKGQKYLLHMSAELARQGFAHKLIIAGSGELLAELTELAAKLGLNIIDGQASTPHRACPATGSLAETKRHGSVGTVQTSIVQTDTMQPAAAQPGTLPTSADEQTVPAHTAAKQFNTTTPPSLANIYFAGFMPEMAPFWEEIDIFVLSSLWEGFGYVLAEGMLAGKPLIAFNINSMPELVIDGQNGLLVQPPVQNADINEPYNSNGTVSCTSQISHNTSTCASELPPPATATAHAAAISSPPMYSAPGYAGTAPQQETDVQVGRRLATAVLQLAHNPAAMQRMGANGREFCINNFSREKAHATLKTLLFS